MIKNLVVKDAFWQIMGRVFSAIAGFFVVKIITPYLGPLRFGDYQTILKYFAIWSAFADFGLYVIALKKLGAIKDKSGNNNELTKTYGKFVGTRFIMISIVYTLALVVAYLIPSYTQNPYLIRGLPLGMLFSASFMSAGIIQIPLQIFWKMEKLSIALIISRIVQLIILVIAVYYAFTNVNFDGSSYSIMVFLIIISSVVISGIIQNIYVYFVGKKYLNLKPIFDFSFVKKIILGNRRYGISYYLSSFHTLIVLILISIFYPTAQNFTYVGIWGLALALIEILLIVPSALGNSMIHKIANYPLTEKLKSFGNLLIFIIWIGFAFFLNFTFFAKSIIYFLSGDKFLSNGTYGSDFILPFLAFVLALSFIKQIFNYLFVATEHQNKLLNINLTGVIIGTAIGVPLIWNFNIIGGIITQILLEILFVAGAVFIAIKHKIFPKINIKNLFTILGIIGIFGVIGYFGIQYDNKSLIEFLIYGAGFNILLLTISYPVIKTIMRRL